MYMCFPSRTPRHSRNCHFSLSPWIFLSIPPLIFNTQRRVSRVIHYFQYRPNLVLVAERSVCLTYNIMRKMRLHFKKMKTLDYCACSTSYAYKTVANNPRVKNTLAVKTCLILYQLVITGPTLSNSIVIVHISLKQLTFS